MVAYIPKIQIYELLDRKGHSCCVLHQWKGKRANPTLVVRRVDLLAPVPGAVWAFNSHVGHVLPGNPHRLLQVQRGMVPATPIINEMGLHHCILDLRRVYTQDLDVLGCTPYLKSRSLPPLKKIKWRSDLKMCGLHYQLSGMYISSPAPCVHSMRSSLGTVGLQYTAV